MAHLFGIVLGFGSILPWSGAPRRPTSAVFDPLQTLSAFFLRLAQISSLI
jgi:hypothetical protein